MSELRYLLLSIMWRISLWFFMK